MAKIPVYEIQNFNFNIANSELYVNSLKSHFSAHPFVEKPHRHNFYLLVLFTHGNGMHEIDFNRFQVKRGSLFLLQPGQMHHWELSQDTEGYIVFYSQQVYNLYFGNKKVEDYPFFNLTGSKPEMLLGDTEMEEMSWYLSRMKEESESAQTRRVDKILNLLDSIHIALSRKYSDDDPHGSHLYHHKIKEFRQLIEHHFASERSPSFYASKLHISLKHLNRICQIILGKTATQIITSRVILEAKRLLAHPKKTISQVADDLNFINYSYFAKWFKKETGSSPVSFRNSLK